MSRDELPPDGFDAADVQELTALARSVTPEDRTLEPVPDDLWDSIAGQVPAPTTNVVPLRRRHRALPYLAAAAASLVIVAGVVGLSLRNGGSDPEIVAQADLDALAEGFQGTAFFEDDDGQLELRLDLGELPPDDGFYELWIIKDLETGQMQSLGPIAGSGAVAWPDGFDPAEYATVDISIEPRDGVPTHSGVSVLRGPLVST